MMTASENDVDHFQEEQELRAKPIVQARLRHTRDKFAAEAAIRNCVYGERFPVDSWPRSSTAQQVRMAYEEMKKDQAIKKKGGQ